MGFLRLYSTVDRRGVAVALSEILLLITEGRL